MHDPLDHDALSVRDVDGVATRTFERGDGEPLVLVHGGGFGSLYSLDTWSLVLPALSERFRVIAFDKLGQGHTDNPTTDDGWTMQAVIEHAAAVLDVLGVRGAHVVGHSMGGLVATRLALDRPDQVRSLVIVDSNTTAPDDPRYPWTAFYEELARRMPGGPPTRASVRMEPEAQSWSTASVTEAFVDRMLEIAELPKTTDATRRLASVRETVWLPSVLALRPETLARIDAEGIAVPTLVVWGADDPSAPLPLAYALYERIAARCADAELHVLGRAGHYSFRDRPEAFVRVVRAFCEAAPPAGGDARRER